MILATNELYVYGNNTYGELGEKEFKNVYTFTKLNYFQNNNLQILKISAGARHNLILCSDFTIYSFGDNSQFQCSGLNGAYSSPYKIIKDNNLEIIDIYAGYNFSVLLSKKGLIWSFGDNSNHKYGTDINLKGSSNPVFSNDMLGLKVGKIFVGINNIAILLSEC